MNLTFNLNNSSNIVKPLKMKLKLRRVQDSDQNQLRLNLQTDLEVNQFKLRVLEDLDLRDHHHILLQVHSVRQLQSQQIDQVDSVLQAIKLQQEVHLDLDQVLANQLPLLHPEDSVKRINASQD